MNEENKQLEILWTPRQLAEYLSVQPGTVYHWLSSGTVIDPTKIFRIGKNVRIPRSEVERIAGTLRQKLEDKSDLK